MREFQTYLEPICDLIRECGQFIRNADRSHLRIDQKCGRANFVTEYDKKVQERLRAGLLEIRGARPRGGLHFAAIEPCFAKISAARSRQPFIPAPKTAPPANLLEE